MTDASDLERSLGVRFANPDLLRQATVHRSYLNENPGFRLSSYERLEFLGDAALGLIVAEELCRRFPEEQEGGLTRLRAAVICRETLCRVAAGLKLGDYLVLGRGEERGGGRTNQSNLAASLEAVIGAVYMDQGLEAARALVRRLLRHELERLSSPPLDYKSRLQELMQSRQQPAPTYRVVEAAGPEHRRMFLVEVLVGEAPLATGSGRTKKAAETAAASAALEKLAERQG